MSTMNQQAGAILDLGHLNLLNDKTYRLDYFRLMVAGLVRRHRPVFNREIPVVSATLSYNSQQEKDWRNFVGVAQGHRLPPLTYYNVAGAPCLLTLLSKLKINFGTLLHLKDEINFLAPLDSFKPNQLYRMTMGLSDIVIKDGNRFIVVLETLIKSPEGENLRSHKDYWFINRCPSKYIELLNEQAHFGRHDVSQFHGLSKRQAEWKQWPQNELQSRIHFVEPNAGKKFGSISGDSNVIHTSKLGARLGGFPKPFLQGFGITNIALHHITQSIMARLSHFEITYVRPTYVDQYVKIYVSYSKFEICDDDNNLIAFGRFE